MVQYIIIDSNRVRITYKKTQRITKNRSLYTIVLYNFSPTSTNLVHSTICLHNIALVGTLYYLSLVSVCLLYLVWQHRNYHASGSSNINKGVEGKLFFSKLLISARPSVLTAEAQLCICVFVYVIYSIFKSWRRRYKVS